VSVGVYGIDTTDAAKEAMKLLRDISENILAKVYD